MILTWHFIRPWWLLMLIPCLVFILYFCNNRLAGGWYKLLGKRHPYIKKSHLRRWHVNRWNRTTWAFPSVLFFCTVVIVMAGPAWEKDVQHVSLPHNVLVIDASILDSGGQTLLHHAIDQLSPSNTAIVVYSGSAHILSPLTTDAATLHYLGHAIDSTIMPIQGQRPEKGVEEAITLLEKTPHKQSRIILISSNIQLEKIASIQTLLKKQKIVLDIISSGTEKSDKANALGKLTASTQGRYTPLRDKALPIIASPVNDSEWKESGYCFMPLVLIAYLLMCRKYHFFMLPPLLLSILICTNKNVYADSEALLTYSGETAWIKKDYAKSAFHFGRLETSIGYYNQGNALANNYQFKEAIHAYNHSLKLNPHHTDAQYNRSIILKLLAHIASQEKQINVRHRKVPLANNLKPETNDLKRFLKRKFSIELYEHQRSKERQP